MKRLIVSCLVLFSDSASSEVTTLNLPANAKLAFDSPKMNKLEEEAAGDRYKYVALSYGESDPRFSLSVYVEPIDCKYGNKLAEIARCFVEQLDALPGIQKEADTPVCKRTRCDVFYVLSRKIGDRMVRQLNLNTLFVYGGRWVDVHFSIVEPVAEDVQRLSKFAASLKLEK